MQYKSYLLESNLNLIKENFFLFYGENLGLKNEFKKNLKAKFKDAEKISFTQEELLKDNKLLLREISNKSLFQDEKIIFIDNINDKILALIEELIESNNEQKIFLFAELLDKKSKIRNLFEKSKICGVTACYADNEITIKNILREKLKGFTGLNAININLIIESCNYDRVKLNNEIDKILTCFRSKIIETEKLESLLNLKVNEDFNLLKDEAFKGNKIKTNKLLGDTLLDDEKNIYYLNLINIRLHRLNEINKLSSAKNLESAVNQLKPPIFWRDKANFIEQAKKWKTKKIKKILNETYKLEVKIKSSSTINKNLLIKKLIVDLCRLANA